MRCQSIFNKINGTILVQVITNTLLLTDKDKIPGKPGVPKSDEVAPAVKNFNDSDDKLF